MAIEFKEYAKNFLKAFGLEVRIIKPKSESSKSGYVYGYGYAKETIEAASKSGLSVSDFLEMYWNQKGAGQRVIDDLKRFGILNNNIKNVCEIGTGAGLVAEKIIELCKPVRYESYETEKGWAEWLTQKYNIISHDPDGRSLCHTQTSSIDLTISHGVFVYLPFLITYRYFQEIVRVTNDEGFVAFDIISEDCFDDETVKKWLESEQLFPCFVGKNYVIDFFAKHKFSLIGEFFNNQFNVGKSKYLIFKKDSSLM